MTNFNPFLIAIFSMMIIGCNSKQSESVAIDLSGYTENLNLHLESIQRNNSSLLTNLSRVEDGFKFTRMDSQYAQREKVNTEKISDDYYLIKKNFRELIPNTSPKLKSTIELLSQFADDLILNITQTPAKGKLGFLVKDIEESKEVLLEHMNNFENNAGIIVPLEYQQMEFELLANHIFQLLLNYKFEEEIFTGLPYFEVTGKTKLPNGDIAFDISGGLTDSDFTETYFHHDGNKIKLEDGKARIIYQADEIKGDSIKISITTHEKPSGAYHSYFKKYSIK